MQGVGSRFPDHVFSWPGVFRKTTPDPVGASRPRWPPGFGWQFQVPLGKRDPLCGGWRPANLCAGCPGVYNRAIPCRSSGVSPAFVADRTFALLRTHTCGELRTEHIGREVTLCGWVDTSRDHGGGLSRPSRPLRQDPVVFDPGLRRGTGRAGQALRSEYVMRVAGAVAHRPEGTTNPEAGDRRDRGPASPAGGTEQEQDAAVHARAAGPARRGPAAEVPLPRSPPAGDAGRPCCCGTG